jgi:hypothetical protein
MGRKKKNHKKVHHRRRVSGIGTGVKDAAIGVVGVAGGIIAGRFLNGWVNPATSATPRVSPTIVGTAEFAAGVFGAAKLKGTFMKGLSLGFAGNGAMYAVSSKGLGLLPASIGYPPPNAMAPPRATLQGFRDVPKIGFPKPGNIGATREAMHMNRMYAGVYGGC